MPLTRAFRHSLLLLLAATAYPSTAAAISADTKDPRKIMEAVEKRSTGDKMTQRIRLLIKDASGSKRVRMVRSRTMKFPGVTRQLMLFESPADVRNSGLLTFDYEAGNKVDDQWLYLPSLRKSTRISSEKKSGAFMGSDLSFADMTSMAVDQYDFTLVKPKTLVGGEPCWLVEARPRTAKAKEETGYVKSHMWISKQKLMPLQAKHWIRKGSKIKLMKWTNIRKVSGVWLAHKMMARTVQGRKVLSTTIIDFANVKVNSGDVKASDFSQRRLEKGL